ncbi:MAG: DUF1795 domain-containing protein [Chloroflexi bacterium]|nr:DUF1795 domain-containing protein [Chloroflexota bacterium]
MKKNAKYVVIVVVAWSFLMLGVGKVLFGKSESASAKADIVGAKANSKQLAKVADRDYVYGFTLKYPDGWGELDRDALRAKDPRAVAGFKKTKGDANSFVIVKTERISEKADLNALLPALRDKMKAELKDFKEANSSRTTLGQADAIQITYTWTASIADTSSTGGRSDAPSEKSLPLKQRMYIGLRNGWAYYVICSSDTSGFSRVDADFERMTKTFNMN